MLRTIHLYGTLAKETGVDEITFDADNVALVLSGLNHKIPEFRKAASKHRFLNVIGTSDDSVVEAVNTSDIHYPLGDSTDIHVLPTLDGADPGTAVVAALALSGATAVIVSVAVDLALALTVSLIAEAIAPKPSLSKGVNDRSFIFSGPVNSVNQGGPVPIIYGTALVGSTVIASNYLTVEVPVGTIANTYLPQGR